MRLVYQVAALIDAFSIKIVFPIKFIIKFEKKIISIFWTIVTICL